MALRSELGIAEGQAAQTAVVVQQALAAQAADATATQIALALVLAQEERINADARELVVLSASTVSIPLLSASLALLFSLTSELKQMKLQRAGNGTASHSRGSAIVRVSANADSSYGESWSHATALAHR